MLGEDNSCYALVPVDFETNLRFELLEYSIPKELILCSEEANYVQILEATQVGTYRYDQILAFDCVQVIIDVHSYCN